MVEVELGEAGLVDAREVLAAGGEHGGDDVGHVDVVADHADLDAAGDEAVVGGQQLLAVDLQDGQEQ